MQAGTGTATPIDLRRVVPILRIFDIAKAREFYLDFLGFQMDWDHRFGENFPLYMQVSRGALALHLSEHAGDCSPGAAVVVHLNSGIQDLHAELTARDYRYMKPGLDRQDDRLEMTVTDPFGNRIRFMQAAGP